jgi:hypothetical protein
MAEYCAPAAARVVPQAARRRAGGLDECRSESPGLLVAVAVVGVAGSSAADLDELVKQGIAVRRAEDNADALKRFEEAYVLQKTPPALAQIGFVEQALGPWAAPDQHLRGARQAANDPWLRKNQPVIDRSLAIIEERIGRLDADAPTTARVACSPTFHQPAPAAP